MIEIAVRPCAPWCVQGPEKHAEEHPDDRSCWSEFEVVPRSLGRPEKMHGRWVEDWLTVVARRRPEGGAEVSVHLVGEDIELTLTATEARHLAEELLRHAKMIESC